MKQFMLIVACLLRPGFGIAEKMIPAESYSIDAKNSAEMTLALEIDSALRALTQAVAACRNKPEAANADCICGQSREFSNLRKTFEEAIRERPAWKTKVLSFSWEGQSVVIAMPGLAKQLESCPK